MMDAFRPPYSTGQGSVSQRRCASFLWNCRPNSDCCSVSSSVSESNWSCQPGGSSSLKNSRTSERNASSSAVNLNSITPPSQLPASRRGSSDPRESGSEDPDLQLKPVPPVGLSSFRLQVAALDAAGDVREHLVVLGTDDGEPLVEDDRGHAPH